MTVDERDRQTLREQLEVVLGDHPAGVLMELLETPGSDDLARRSDVLAIGARLDGIDARLDQMDRRFDQIDARLDQMDRRFDLIDARFEKVDARFEKAEAALTLVSTESSKTTIFTGIAVAMSSWGLLFAALGFS